MDKTIFKAMNIPEKAEWIAGRLSGLERKCCELANFIKEQIPSAGDVLLGFFYEILEQENKIDNYDWFKAPDEKFERDEKLKQIPEIVRTLKEYKVSIDRMIVHENGKEYSVEELLNNLDKAENNVLDNLYSSLINKLKLIEVISYANILRVKTSSEKKKPSYHNIDIAYPKIYLEKVPAIINSRLFNDFELNNDEKEVMSLINGERKLRSICEDCTMKFNAINLVYYMKREGYVAW